MKVWDCNRGARLPTEKNTRSFYWARHRQLGHYAKTSLRGKSPADLQESTYGLKPVPFNCYMSPIFLQPVKPDFLCGFSARLKSGPSHNTAELRSFNKLLVDQLERKLNLARGSGGLADYTKA